MSWPARIVLSLLMIVAAYAVGLIAKRVVWRRLGALARRTAGAWDDAIVAEIGKRVPFWALLLGMYLAAGFWTLPPNVGTAVNGALFVLIVGSLTFLCAGLLAGLAHQYGHTVQEALPITTLTEHRVRVGEDLVMVAARLQTDPWQLVRDNNLWDQDVHAGMVIRVRPTEPFIRPVSSRPTYRIHSVGRGENLTAIARRYGTTIAAVQSANSLGRRTIIRIGQRLRIPTD